MQNKRYNILLLEDDDEDIMLFKDHLADSNLNIEIVTVEKKDEYINALKQRTYDAIISDNKLSDIDALKALKLARDYKNDAPFIVLSGSVSNDLANEALRTGASDVIKKGDYYRLLPTLEREILVWELKFSNRKIEKKLHKKDVFLQLIAENIDYALGLISVDGRIIFFTKSFESLSGYKVNEVVGENLFSFIADEDVNKVKSALKKDIHHNIHRSYRINGKWRHKEGRLIEIEARIRTIGNGKITKYAVIFKDKTEEILYKEKLTYSEKKYTLLNNELLHIIETSNSPIFGIDLEGNINEWNHTCEKITGYTKKEVIYKNMLQVLVREDDRSDVLKLLSNAMLINGSLNYELSIKAKDNSIRSLLFNATARRNVEGNVTGVICHGQDITELIEYKDSLEKKVEQRTEELKKSVEKEKELAGLKVKFVSMASHEFRTPLSTIKFAASFIRRYYDTATKEQVFQRLAKIDDQIENMVYLLDDVLQIGKNDDTKILTNLQQIKFKDYISAIKSDLESQYPSHKIDIKYLLNEEHIFSDRQLLKSILVNLLSNAIKYSPGAFSVSCTFEIKNDLLNISVRDFGVGIDPNDQQSIFEPFYRTNTTKNIPGTGLGLSITKRAVESLKGTIYLKSSSPQGTEFVVVIPYKKNQNNEQVSSS